MSSNLRTVLAPHLETAVTARHRRWTIRTTHMAASGEATYLMASRMDSLTPAAFIGRNCYATLPIQVICKTPEEVRIRTFAAANLSRLPGVTQRRYLESTTESIHVID